VRFQPAPLTHLSANVVAGRIRYLIRNAVAEQFSTQGTSFGGLSVEDRGSALTRVRRL